MEGGFGYYYYMTVYLLYLSLMYSDSCILLLMRMCAQGIVSNIQLGPKVFALDRMRSIYHTIYFENTEGYNLFTYYTVILVCSVLTSVYNLDTHARTHTHTRTHMHTHTHIYTHTLGTVIDD